MKFKEIINRLTGISTPIFGASWKPPETAVAVAKRAISFLEDRRVLYNPFQLEDPSFCVHSVIEIRHFLTEELGRLNADTDLAKTFRAMRAACRKFLDSAPSCGPGYRSFRHAPDLFSALGELRGVFGIHVAKIAAQHGLDVEDDLASILPIEDDATRHDDEKRGV